MKSDPASVGILLNDTMVDLDRPVTVRWKDKTVFQGIVRRKAAVLARTLAEREDPRLVFSGEVWVDLTGKDPK